MQKEETFQKEETVVADEASSAVVADKDAVVADKD